MKTKRALILLLAAQTWCVALSHAESPKMIGKWKVDIEFGNGDSRSVYFEAREAGNGSFSLVDPKSSDWDGGKPPGVKWTLNSDNSVTFSGPMEFPLGNV